MAREVLVLPGDYIGPEIMEEAVKVLRAVDRRFALGIELEHGLLGGAAIDACGVPLPDETLAQAREADAILLGAVGGPKWDGVERPPGGDVPAAYHQGAAEPVGELLPQGHPQLQLEADYGAGASNRLRHHP